MVIGLAMVKVILLLLATPPTVTTTLTTPFESPLGTTAVMDLLPQAVVDATVPPNVMVLPVPFVLPKLFPVTVTDVPDGPEVGERLVMLGAAANSEAEVRMTNEKAVKARSTARQVERILSPSIPICASAQPADTAAVRHGLNRYKGQ